MRRITPALATGLACLAAPALAQAPICGGISAVGEWVGGDEAGSDLMGPEAFFDLSGQVPIGGHMVRMFTLSQDGPLRVDVRAVPSGDPYVSIYAADGTEVAADDDGAGEFGARVQTELAAGTYSLAARSYASGITDVSVQMGRPQLFGDDPAPAAPQPTDAPTPAAPQPAPGRVGAFCGEPDVAMLGGGTVDLAALRAGVAAQNSAAAAPGYGFTLTEATPLTITATSEFGDPLIRLVDAAGNLLAENDDFDGLDSRIDMTAALAPGTYCVEVDDLNSGQDPITVALAAFDPVADRARRLGAMEFAPASTDDVARTAIALDTVHSQDFTASSTATWFDLSIPSGGLVLIDAVGTGVDPEVRLFDRLGREVAYNDDGPDSLDSFLVHRAAPGGYVLGVRIREEGAEGNVRLVLERYVPAQ